jgi:predicted nucleotidyltransferase
MSMDEYARPATLDDLKLLVRSLNAKGADYLLIGGYALFVHGYHRGTVDIDILAPMSREVGRKIREALMTLPEQAAHAVELDWFEEGDTIRVGDAFVVDILFKTCGETYETLCKYAETIEFDGIPIRTVNLEGLLLTKQTLRDKDVSDRLVLERALQAHRQQNIFPQDPDVQARHVVENGLDSRKPEKTMPDTDDDDSGPSP